MREEVEAGVSYLLRLFNRNMKLESQKLEEFGERLTEILCEKYADHWYPEDPVRGQAYRCIRVNSWQQVDDVLLKACAQSDIVYTKLPLPVEITLWIDPKEVCCRLGEQSAYFTVAEFTVLESGKSSSMIQPDVTSDYHSELSSGEVLENSSEVVGGVSDSSFGCEWSSDDETQTMVLQCPILDRYSGPKNKTLKEIDKTVMDLQTPDKLNICNGPSEDGISRGVTLNYDNMPMHKESLVRHAETRSLTVQLPRHARTAFEPSGEDALPDSSMRMSICQDVSQVEGFSSSGSCVEGTLGCVSSTEFYRSGSFKI
ncbi:uncharacterized protein LOC115476174 [Microcaecilia unicolor]|uniref:Uncharacterized protein LOC115476174 n=1 Tax=Microcaecilia unicolor TaxID=1415580 RepID=A0A6P7YTH2_9AMPH|nr:uncharacterized protein LOC115476174 [Microcaecilia unicolor]